MRDYEELVKALRDEDNCSTTMTNYSFCAECYKALVEKPLMVLSEKAGLNIPLPEPPKEETP